MKKIETLKGQTLFDISAQETGGLEGVFGIAIENGKSVTDVPSPGTAVMVNSLIINKRNLDYYKDRALRPGTSGFGNTGIGYYIIGKNFIIQ